jgi:hypothetical protein
MQEIINLWVPENTPMGTKPVQYSLTQPSVLGWKPIQIPKTQFNSWNSQGPTESLINIKKLLLG